ncbi:unnamed protein product [Kluyveromyces dobzhanskii CBS 2104]|uniref:WGS project CCBQ000000000 data, contig 00058 n=1 Tax=Kluyveromyces dobzhanskii CBS 2104 TaxID=1427455 RepID=A0A0A8LBF9_9SACH|nr:unnamed protein product [Kluyveromyces dobzhanskii CBS 2104]
MASIQQQDGYKNSMYPAPSANIEEWFVAPPTADVWMDKSSKEVDTHAWASDSSSIYSLSPSDQYRAMFDSDLLLNNQDTLETSTAFTASNNVSEENSPLMNSANPENGFELNKDQFSQLPLPAEMAEITNMDSVDVDNELQVKIEDGEDIKKPKKRVAQKTQNKKRGSRKRLTADQRVTHNMIEKRYRININTKIGKLQKIIPWVACEDTAFVVDNKVLSAGEDSLSLKTMKLNKSMILEKAVDYILYLQNNERLFELEVQRLRKEITELKANASNQ